MHIILAFEFGFAFYVHGCDTEIMDFARWKTYFNPSVFGPIGSYLDELAFVKTSSDIGTHIFVDGGSRTVNSW